MRKYFYSLLVGCALIGGSYTGYTLHKTNEDLKKINKQIIKIEAKLTEEEKYIGDLEDLINFLDKKGSLIIDRTNNLYEAIEFNSKLIEEIRSLEGHYTSKLEGLVYSIIQINSTLGSGSGVLVHVKEIIKKEEDKEKKEYEGYIITVAHGLKNKEDDLFCTMYERGDIMKEIAVGKAIVIDKEKDLAIVKINLPEKPKNVAKLFPLENVEELKRFRKIMGAGYVNGIFLIQDFGEINRYVESKNIQHFLTTFYTVGGYSGGGIFDVKTGKLIAITSGHIIQNYIKKSGEKDVKYLHKISNSVSTRELYNFLKENDLEFIYKD